MKNKTLVILLASTFLSSNVFAGITTDNVPSPVIPVIVNVPLPSKKGMPRPKLSDLGRYETQIDWDIYSDVILGVTATDIDNCAFEHQTIKVEVLKNNYGKDRDFVDLEYYKTGRVVYSHEEEYARPPREYDLPF